MHKDNLITEVVRQHIADNFKNTELGLVRIRKNLSLAAFTDSEVVKHCKMIILSTPINEIELKGKNYYVRSTKFSAVLTINRSSLGIITAKKGSPNKTSRN